jgi:FixJ family two-component response regulator
MAVSQKVIAIIDDHDSILSAMESLVRSLGYGTEVYNSGEGFIEGAMKSEASCLLVDVELGDITGVELVRHLSAMGLTFPTIFMTGSQDATARKQATDFGCVAYLLKPFPANQLVDALREAIGTTAKY